MEISSLTIKIILLLIPGFISYFVYKRITTRPNKRSDLMFISISIFLGVLSYTALALFNSIFSCYEYETLKTFEIISADNSSFDYRNESKIPYKEIVFASIFGIIIAYVFTYIDNTKIINKVAIRLKISNKLNDENLYSVYLAESTIEWVYVRDIKNSLTYSGNVQLFSDKEGIKELVLREVSVFSYPDSELLYNVSSVYLSFNNENVIIEQANLT